MKFCLLGFLLILVCVWAFPLPRLPALPGKYKTIGCRIDRINGVECRIFYPVSTRNLGAPATKLMKYLHHGIHLAKGLSVFGLLQTANDSI